MPSEISFNEESHEYRVRGLLVPSVSQVLKEFGLMDCFRKNETALSNGSAIHKTLELADLGILDYRGLDPRLKKCLDLWANFKKKFEIGKILAVEKQVAFSVLYAGTVDRIVELKNGHKLVLDFKSGNPQKWGALQTAGYAIAANLDRETTERCCLKIHWDMSEAKYCPYHDKADYNVFLSMVNVYHWKKNNGYLKKEAK